MRIDLNSNINSNIGAAETGLEKSAGARSGSANSAAQSAAQAEFSEAGTTVSRLAAAALSAPDVRQEKVQALQSQVQSGNYHVVSAQIAASLLDQIHVW